jgi:hypothetical protein
MDEGPWGWVELLGRGSRYRMQLRADVMDGWARPDVHRCGRGDLDRGPCQRGDSPPASGPIGPIGHEVPIVRCGLIEDDLEDGLDLDGLGLGEVGG